MLKWVQELSGSDNVMIGLDIMVKNAADNFLYKIFNGIDVSDYIWIIDADEILYTENDKHMQELFSSNVMSGEDFLKCISRENYYMIFADIKAYPIGSDCSCINTYEDYLKSDCQIILLCADSSFIDFYSKDIEIINKVNENCINYNFEQVNPVTEQNDTRTRMSVW